jgi:carboxyl-terminal processing protease
VRGRDQSQEIVHRSKGTDPTDDPLVILIGRNTASASEIVAGAIQDYGRGLVVGETSFGKGLVQRVFQLPFGTGLTLTTARYYTPYGRSLQRDYSSGSFYDYYVRHDQAEETQTQRSNGPAPQQQQQPLTAAPSPTPTPHPSGPAVTTAAGRVFYGGGGITPDVEVKPLASTPLRLRIAEAAFFFTRELAAGQIQGLESYRIEKPDPRHSPRAADYPVTERVVEAFRNFLKREEELNLQPAELEEELDFVRLRLREEMITAAYSSDMGTRILLDSDPQILRAIEALPEAKRLTELARNSALPAG